MNSLRGRLLLAAGIVLLLFVLVTALALESADHERAEQAVQNRLQGLVYAVLSSVEVTDEGVVEVNELTLPEPRFNQFDSGLGALIAETDGTILWQTSSLLRDPQPPVALPVGAWRLTPPRQGYPFFSLALSVSWALTDQERRFSVIVVEDSNPFIAQRKRFRRTLWLWLGAAALVLLSLLLAILYWGLVPVRTLTNEIAALQAGDQEGINGQYPAELQPLSQSLNALISNERLRQARYRLALDDLAHSLKTPLAVLRSEVGDDPDCGPPIRQMQQQIDYHLKRALAGSGRTFGQHTRLAPLARQVIAALEKVYADKQIRFTCDLDDRLRLPFERGDLMEVLGNLLDNASKWCRKEVSLTARRKGERVEIIIEDDGPGFPPQAEQLLHRGIRADLQKEGQGIGLALVADILLSLEGDIQLGRASKLGGASVQLGLPTI